MERTADCSVYTRKGVLFMIPCREGCAQYQEGCHKTCPRWRAMQEQQHAETARKKEYLRQADEACRAVLSQCRRCGGYVVSAGSY